MGRVALGRSLGRCLDQGALLRARSRSMSTPGVAVRVRGPGLHQAVVEDYWAHRGLLASRPRSAGPAGDELGAGCRGWFHHHRRPAGVTTRDRPRNHPHDLAAVGAEASRSVWRLPLRRKRQLIAGLERPSGIKSHPPASCPTHPKATPAGTTTPPRKNPPSLRSPGAAACPAEHRFSGQLRRGAGYQGRVHGLAPALPPLCRHSPGRRPGASSQGIRSWCAAAIRNTVTSS